MGKQAMLFDFHNMAFKNSWLAEVANKKPLSTQSLSLDELKFPVKKAYFLQLQNFVSQATTTQGICCLLCWKMNVSKVIWKWFLTLQPRIFKINYIKFTNLSKIKGMGIIWGIRTIYSIYALIYTLIDWRTCVKERKASLYFLH